MNFRGILSKSSHQSTSSSEKNLPSSDEILRLHGEIELYKQTIESLKISVESRDAAIGTLAREKEKLYVELKSVQRTNRNLHQQLLDERDIHSKEKDFLIGEIKRLTKNNNTAESNVQDRPEDVQSNYSLKEEIKTKDEVIYALCTKYLKIRSGKLTLKKKLEEITENTEKVCENVVMLLYENKQFLDDVLCKLMRASSVTQDSKSYMRLLKLNANLQYENTQLKVCLSLKEFKDELYEETSNTNISQLKSTPSKNSKSKGNVSNKSINQKRMLYRPRYSKNYTRTIPKNNVIKQFSSIHEILSPHFRRKKFNSDTCLFH